MWFDRSNKRWNALQDVVGQQFETSITTASRKRKLEQDDTPRKRLKGLSTEDIIDGLKNAKLWLHEEVAQSESEPLESKYACPRLTPGKS